MSNVTGNKQKAIKLEVKPKLCEQIKGGKLVSIKRAGELMRQKFKFKHLTCRSNFHENLHYSNTEGKKHGKKNNKMEL